MSKLKRYSGCEMSEFMICWDSLSFWLAIENYKAQTPFILKVLKIHKSLVAIDKDFIFTWIYNHIGINGNTVVDQEVKDKLYDTIDILHTLNLNVLKYIFKCYQKTIWNQQIDNNWPYVVLIMVDLHIITYIY